MLMTMTLHKMGHIYATYMRPLFGLPGLRLSTKGLSKPSTERPHKRGVTVSPAPPLEFQEQGFQRRTNER